MTTLDLTSDSVFDHVRSSDNELVGYITITDDGEFIPFDLLHRQAGPPVSSVKQRSCSTRSG